MGALLLKFSKYFTICIFHLPIYILKMKTLKLAFILLLSVWFSFAQIDHFFVQVTPNTLKPNEAADLTIKALDDKGNVVKDYQGSVIMDVEWLTEKDVTLPNGGFYEFAADDKWQKTFSKWLIFVKEWDFKMNVADLSDDKIKSTANISVKSKATAASGWTVNVLSPIEWSIEKSSSVNITASSTSPNTPFEIYIDDKKLKDWLSDENWSINSTVDELKAWDHKVVIKLTSVDGKVLSESKPVSFKVSIDSWELLKSLEVKPSTNITKWDKPTIEVLTKENVSSAELMISGMGNLPMDKSSAGKFTKQVTLDKVGSYTVGVKLAADADSKEYKNKATINVKEKVAIKEVKVNKDKTKLNLEWTYVGTVDKFRVLYTTGKDNLNYTGQIVSWTVLTWVNMMVVDKAQASIEKIDGLATYFIKVQPLNWTWVMLGDESQIIAVEPDQKGAASCKIKGIKISTEQQGNKYYLVWNKVENATKYVIYKSDTESKSLAWMQKVWETQDTKFEYPFNKASKKDLYAYYAVEAECQDWVKAQLDSMKKVKVGPFDTILFIILTSSLMYLIYRMYNFTR